MSKIAFDLDDILLDFNGALTSYHHRVYGTSYARKDIKSFFLHRLWGCDEAEGVRRVFEFFETPDHWNAQPIIGATQAVSDLSWHHEIHIITSKPEVLRERTLMWLEKHFGNSFKSENVHFTNFFHGTGKKRTKSEVCTELGIQVFVDDSLDFARNVSGVGIPVLLFDTPWNQGEIKEPITRVYSWEEIVRSLS